MAIFTANVTSALTAASMELRPNTLNGAKVSHVVLRLSPPTKIFLVTTIGSVLFPQFISRYYFFGRKKNKKEFLQIWRKSFEPRRRMAQDELQLLTAIC